MTEPINTSKPNGWGRASELEQRMRFIEEFREVVSALRAALITDGWTKEYADRLVVASIEQTANRKDTP